MRCLLSESVQNNFPTLALPKSGLRVEGPTFLSACPVCFSQTLQAPHCCFIVILLYCSIFHYAIVFVPVYSITNYTIYFLSAYTASPVSRQYTASQRGAG